MTMLPRVAATALEPPPPLGDISALSATAGAAAGTIALSWTPGANATRHWIAGVKDADRSSLAVWMAADNMDSHTVTGLDGGAAYILTVISGRDLAGSGESEWSAWAPWVIVTPD